MTDSDQLVQYPVPPVDAIEPPPEWERLRQQCPVARLQLPSGDEAALLTRYDDVRQVLSDPRFARTADGAARVSVEGAGVFDRLRPGVPQSGDGHQRWRRMITKWFTAKRMAAHLAFGAGPHSCIGQSLARTELQVVLEVLLRRLPTLALAVPSAELPLVEGLLVGGLREVRVIW